MIMRRSGVSAVIGALIMVAIAVSLSAALFVSTTGYLSGLTSSLGNAQPGQNRATQSIVVVENTVAKAYTTGFSSALTNGYVVLYVRNVGSVPLTLGSLTVTAPPTNAGQTKSFTAIMTPTPTSPSTGTWSAPFGATGNVYVCSELPSVLPAQSNCATTNLCTSQGVVSSLAALTVQQNTARIWIAWCPGALPKPVSGDAFQIQVSSTVGASNIVTINVP
jgi:flagellin-like protein